MAFTLQPRWWMFLVISQKKLDVFLLVQHMCIFMMVYAYNYVKVLLSGTVYYQTHYTSQVLIFLALISKWKVFIWVLQPFNYLFLVHPLMAFTSTVLHLVHLLGMTE